MGQSWVLGLMLAVSVYGTLLTYGPPSSYQPTGFGTFEALRSTFNVPGDALGGRLLGRARLAGMLAGKTTVLFGAFCWAGPSLSVQAYNLLLLLPDASLRPLAGPSVWGAGVEAAVWRDEAVGSFFVVGQLNGLESSPQAGVRGVASCNFLNGCTAISAGLQQLPQSLKYASIAFDPRLQALYVMFRSTELKSSLLTGVESVNTLLAVFQDNSWQYISLFKNQAVQGETPRVMGSQQALFLNLAPSVVPDRYLSNVFCPPRKEAVPSLLRRTQGSSLCFTAEVSPATFGLNSTFSAATVNSVYALDLETTGTVWEITNDQVVDVTFNLNAFRTTPLQRMVLFTSSHEVFAFLSNQHGDGDGEVDLVLHLDREKHCWSVLFSVGGANETECKPLNLQDSVFASQAPVSVDPSGVIFLWSCPYPSNQHVTTANVTFFSYSMTSQTKTLLLSTPLASAAVLQDMCASGPSVWMRGSFDSVARVKVDEIIPAASGLAQWLPGTDEWIDAGYIFSNASIFSKCTVSREDMWIPFARNTSHLAFSIARYDPNSGGGDGGNLDHVGTGSNGNDYNVGGGWLVLHPLGIDSHEEVRGLNASLAASGHSKVVLTQDNTIWMTWRLINQLQGWTFGVVVKMPISLHVMSGNQGRHSLDHQHTPRDPLQWQVVTVLRGGNGLDMTSCWADNTCWADDFASTLFFGQAIWVVGSFTFQDPVHGWLRAVVRLDPESGDLLPVQESAEEYVFITAGAVGSFSPEADPALWVGGTIKTLPGSNMGGAMNVASLNSAGNFTATTKDLLSPPTQLNVQTLFFTGDDDQIMVVLSQDWRHGYETFSSGMVVFRSGEVFPDPATQSMYFVVANAADIHVDTTVSSYAIAVEVIVTVLIIVAVSVVIPLIWWWAGSENAFKYIALPSYQDHGIDTNLAALLHDGSIRKLDPAQVELGEELGIGGQGLVVRATYQENVDIACKAIFDFDAKLFSQFVREIKLTSSIEHKNIVTFVGILVKDDTLYMCTEFMDTDLAHVIPVLTLPQQIKVARDVAAGMAFLHSFEPQILHRDLKPQNILLSTRLGRAKIADFGVSRLMSQGLTKMTRNAGTIFYLAPEVFSASSSSSSSSSSSASSARGDSTSVAVEYGPEADVFSYGLTLLEMFSREPPYPSNASAFLFEFVDAVRSRKLSPNVHNLPDDCPARSIIVQCINFSPELRPSFEQVREMLGTLPE